MIRGETNGIKNRKTIERTNYTEIWVLKISTKWINFYQDWKKCKSTRINNQYYKCSRGSHCIFYSLSICNKGKLQTLLSDMQQLKRLTPWSCKVLQFSQDEIENLNSPIVLKHCYICNWKAPEKDISRLQQFH